MVRTLRPAGWIRTTNAAAVLGWDRWRERGTGLAGGRAFCFALSQTHEHHQILLPTVIAHGDRAERWLQGKAGIKCCLCPFCNHWAEWPCRPELCVLLGAKMEGNGKLQLPYFKADCTEVSSLLAGRALVLLSWPETCAYLWPSFGLGNRTEPNPLTGRNFHKFQLVEGFPLMLFSHEKEFGCLILSPAGPILISFLKMKIYDAMLLKN